MKFPGDWPAIREKLEHGSTPADWDIAFDACFRERINARYLEPIKVIRAERTYLGEGFLILTVLCSLIEFLAALRLCYHHKPGVLFGVNNEYGSSRRLYKDFLKQHEPFKSLVKTDANAAAFYEDIRCALVHEAQTRNGWRVWAATAGNVAVNFEDKYVNRDLLSDAIANHITAYQVKLREDEELQAAFIRKFQYIADHAVQPEGN